MAVVAAVGLAAAVPIALAMEDRAQQIQIDALHNTLDLHHDALTFIEGTLEPIEFINAVSASASHRLSNGVLLAEGVTDRVSNFIDQQDGKFVTSEKNTARAMMTATNYYYNNHSRPISDDPWHRITVRSSQRSVLLTKTFCYCIVQENTFSFGQNFALLSSNYGTPEIQPSGQPG